jgi:hypothetical protein
MHSNNSKLNILCLVSNEFNNSLVEIKEYLKFCPLFYKDFSKNEPKTNYSAVLIDEAVLKNKSIISKIYEEKNSAKILIFRTKLIETSNFDLLIEAPVSINELNKKIIKLITSRKFTQNSSVSIKEYILDKNEKKLKKDSIYIIVTEKEVQVLELLSSEKKPLSKKVILNKIWQYAVDADTHTVETHIYRLRKKILDKFNDNKLIISSKKGYLI